MGTRLGMVGLAPAVGASHEATDVTATVVPDLAGRPDRPPLPRREIDAHGLRKGPGLENAACDRPLTPHDVEARWSVDACRLTATQREPCPSRRRRGVRGGRSTRARISGGVRACAPRRSFDLAAVLKVNRNTVLRALRQLRDEGLLEVRRGRGVTVVATPEQGALHERVLELVELARRHGYRRAELVELIESLP